MTTPERDPSELRDPALDAAWRALPRDEPPPALDAAILAAAHRAVHAKPQEAAAARSPWRWWAPLAAAATIGAVAIGVIQLAPDEHATITGTVSDSPRVASKAPAPAAPREALAEADKERVATTADARDQAKAVESKADAQDKRLATDSASPERAKPVEPASKADAMPRSEQPKAVAPATKSVEDAPRKTTAGTIQRSDAARDQAKAAEPAASAAGKQAMDANARSATAQERSPAAMADAPRDRPPAMAQRSADPFPARPSAAEPAPQMEAKRKQESVASSRDPQPFPAQPSPPAAAPVAPPPSVVAPAAPPPSPAPIARRDADIGGLSSAPSSMADAAGGATGAPAARERAKDAEMAKPTAPASAPPPPMADAQTQASGARDEMAAKRQRDALARNNLASAPAPASPPVGAASSAGRAAGMKEESTSSFAQRTSPAPATGAGAANEQRAAQPSVLAKVTGDKARSADDYIATIRRLRSEGKVEEAERELKAFRTAYPDADARLPTELRGWATGVAR